MAPLPTAVHVPASGTAEMMKAPSVVESTLFTFTLKMGKGDASVTTTVYVTCVGRVATLGGPFTTIVLLGTFEISGVTGRDGADSCPLPAVFVA